MQEYRITSGYCPGAGDNGKTKASFNGKRKSKGGSDTEFYGAVEELQCRIDKFLVENYQASEEAIAILTWLRAALPSVNSFCYLEGKSEDHAFPDSFKKFVIEQQEVWAIYAPALEFQRFTSRNTVELYYIGIQVRAVERDYVKWEESLECSSSLDDQKRISEQGIIWNRLSKLFWAIAKREEWLQADSPVYWTGKMPECTLKVANA